MAKATSKGGLGDLMALAGKKPAAKSKSSTPSIDAPESLRPAIAEWIEAARALKTAEANKKAAEAQMVETATELRTKVCRENGQYHASIRLDGKASGQITMVQMGKWKQMTAAEHQDALLAAFGDDAFAKYFTTRTELNLDCDKLLNLPQGSKVMQRLVKLLADELGEQASEVMTCPCVIVPTEKYLHDAVFDPKIAEKAADVAADGHAVLYTPSFRL